MRATVLLLCLALGGCALFERKLPEPDKVEPPLIDCSERMPPESMPRRPATTNWRRWAAYARRLLGVIEAEVGKRAEVADCLDREREAGRIR